LILSATTATFQIPTSDNSFESFDTNKSAHPSPTPSSTPPSPLPEAPDTPPVITNFSQSYLGTCIWPSPCWISEHGQRLRPYLSEYNIEEYEDSNWNYTNLPHTAPPYHTYFAFLETD
jgi:hypothetical protein